MKITTEYVCPAIPVRDMDWSAIDYDTYDGAPDSNCPIGTGRTEEAAIRDLLEQMEICTGCHALTGALDTDKLTEQGTCVFGCGHRVDPDTGMCPHCKDHSANSVECLECGVTYYNWGGTWEAQP